MQLEIQIDLVDILIFSRFLTPNIWLQIRYLIE